MEPAERASEQSLAELAALADTAGADTVATVLQNRAAPDPRSFIGEGKVREIRELLERNDCGLIVFDNELSPSQHRVLSEELGVKVLDRSGLILDIFAQRAATREGQLQVELAQYQYLLPRLTGIGNALRCVNRRRRSSPIGTAAPARRSLNRTAGTSAADPASEGGAGTGAPVRIPKGGSGKRTMSLSLPW
jgi:GTP-binding protein HflX